MRDTDLIVGSSNMEGGGPPSPWLIESDVHVRVGGRLRRLDCECDFDSDSDCDCNCLLGTCNRFTLKHDDEG